MKTVRIIMVAALVAAASIAAPVFAANDSATIGMVLEPPNLDPTSGTAAAIDEVTYANVFQGLTRFTRDGSIKPDLAQSWDVSDDGLTYTFHLRKGVTFHDGSKMTAKDVAFSLNRARGDDSTNAQKGLFKDIKRVDVVDPHTVKVTLAERDGGFITNMAWGDAQIVSQKTAAKNATHPVGTGPFEFGEWVKGDHVTLKRYPDYWGKPAKLKSVTFKFISDPTAAFSAMMSGGIDAYPNFPAPENLRQFKADPRFKVTVGDTEGETILAMNNGEKPFSNIKVRKAVAHAINRKAIIDGAEFGYGTPIGSHYSPQDPAYVDLTGQSKYDPKLSKKLLKEAGYPDGFQTTLKLPPPSYARRGGEIVAAELRQVGIRPKIINVEWAQWLNGVFKDKNYDMTIVAHTEPLDIDIYARDDYYFNYHAKGFKAIMDKLARTTDKAERHALLQKAQRKIADDYVNAFLFELPKLGVAKKDLMGLWKNEPTQANDMTQVYWKN